MSLDPASWLPRAQQLPVGKHARVNHDCGEGRTLRIEHNGEGWRAWCWRCNEGGFVPEEVPLAEKLRRLREQSMADLAAGLSAVPPEPRVGTLRDWPLGAAQWWLKAGLGAAEAGRLGVYYHPPSDRVILPVPGPLGRGFWQGRAWQRGRQPKYLGPTLRPAGVVARWGRAEVPTLTEDILSAMKIGQISEGIAVMGTTVSKAVIEHLLRRNCAVNVWLDPDAAGRKGATRIAAQLRACGVEVRVIKSDRDPKLHYYHEIERFLWK